MFRYIVLGWPNHPLQFHCTCPRRQGATTISPRQQCFCLCWLRTTHAPSSDPLNTHKKKRKKKNTNRNPCFPISIFEHCYSELDLELLAVMDGEKREKEYDKKKGVKCLRCDLNRGQSDQYCEYPIIMSLWWHLYNTIYSVVFFRTSIFRVTDIQILNPTSI